MSEPLAKWEQFNSFKTTVQLIGGRRDLPDGDYLVFDSVDYGDLDGDGGEEAAVHLHYGTGGTRTWDYLYVFKDHGGRAELISRFVSGSRADGGLVRSSIRSNQLLLDLQDSERRTADCCSLGFVRLTYRLVRGAFQEVAPRMRDSFRIRYHPLYAGKPNTVEPSIEGRIVYIDPKGTRRLLTAAPGKDSAPSLSFDQTSVTFVRNKTEVWTVRIDGSGEHKIFSCTAPEDLACDLPQFSPEGNAVYVIREVLNDNGGVWRIDLPTGRAVPFVSNSAQFVVVQKGPSRGFLLASQRTISRDPSDEQYPKYPFFLFAPEGIKIRKVGEDDEDIFDLAERLER